MSSVAREPSAAGDLELATPTCEKGIGKVILAPDSKDLIAGVRIHPYPVWPDDRGYFLEIARMGQGLAARLSQRDHAGFGGAQLSRHHQGVSLPSPPDRLLGAAAMACCKWRWWICARESPTFGARNTLYVGALRRWQLLVPPGIAHGYKVIGTSPAMLVYFTDRFYDPAGRGPYPVRRSEDSIRLGNSAQVSLEPPAGNIGARLFGARHITVDPAG